MRKIELDGTRAELGCNAEYGADVYRYGNVIDIVRVLLRFKTQVVKNGGAPWLAPQRAQLTGIM